MANPERKEDNLESELDQMFLAAEPLAEERVIDIQFGGKPNGGEIVSRTHEYDVRVLKDRDNRLIYQTDNGFFENTVILDETTKKGRQRKRLIGMGPQSKARWRQPDPEVYSQYAGPARTFSEVHGEKGGDGET